MKHFLIKYRFKHGSRAEWHEDIARFISALESDPDLNGKISYRSMRAKEGDDYYHLASAEDERTVKTLANATFFRTTQKGPKLSLTAKLRFCR